MVVRLLIALVLLGAAGAPAAADPGEKPTLEDLATLRELGAVSTGGLALSPDGRWLAIFQTATDLEVNDVHYQLLLLAADGSAAPRLIGDGGGILLHDHQGRRTGGAVERFPRWSPNGHWIAFIAERGGRAELWRSDTRGNSARVVVTQGDVRDFAWSGDDKLIIRTATPRDALTRQEEAQINYGFRVAPGYSGAFARLPNPDVDIGAATFALNLRTSEISPASSAESAMLGARPISEARIGPRDPQSRVAAPPLGLFVTDSGGQEAACVLPQCQGRLREFGLLRTGEVWFTRLEGFAEADHGLYVWSPSANTIRTLRHGDERLHDCSASGAVLFCLQEFATQPRRVVAVNALNGATSVLYDPNPGWGRLVLPPIERLRFEDTSGLRSYAHLVFPAGYETGRLYPMVIVQYRSRGFLRGGTGGENPIFPLAARGYFVLSVSRPEPTERSREISRAELHRELYVGDEEERMKLDSLDGLIAQLTARRLVDPNRIAITGMSDGSETLFWMLRRRTFAAAVSSSPPADPSHYTMAEADIRANMGALGISGPWPGATDPWWVHNAPIYYAEQLRTPLLMNLPESEAIHALPLHVRLQELGVPVETYIYPGMYHIKWRPSALLSAQRRAIAWIDFWLQDRGELIESNPDDVLRWRAMPRPLER